MRLTSITFCHASNGMSTSRYWCSSPALFTSRSRPPKRLARLGEGALHVVLAGDVHGHGQRAAAGRLDLGDDALRLVRWSHVVDRHGGAVGGELVADALADTRVSPGDQRAPPLEQASVGGCSDQGGWATGEPYPATVWRPGHVLLRPRFGPAHPLGLAGRAPGRGRLPLGRLAHPLALPADRRLRLPLGLPHRRAGVLRRHGRMDVPAALRLAQRVRDDARSRRGRLPGRAPTASTSPPAGATYRERTSSRRPG